ncbi:methyl-accepting chemotaxis protein [Actinoplanes sp. SE50]|uniref:methyl-accepting chemotaxis protein n=1 Tax=unclassified Actinoplanes TaxID=2626549 RepID=UPI00023ECD20|nr:MULTISPECIES: methyl-accepting chemotaxis protein [unclassified Actinoplanes]AEV86026.1 methyl-accepting chemotaxis sensory transducer [Actinoplanes sp. SE50/110]ATO84424.1 methyl-accepting chemotaxis protein [Actinoplanes sp. SE50]SLM01834.1 methyl-accepting chemotaxis protein [Actinoplanes sp. SE50/110]
MMDGQTFGRKLGFGVGLTGLLTLLSVVVSTLCLLFVVHAKDRVIAAATHELTGAENLNRLMEKRLGDYRGFMLYGSDEFATATGQDRADFLAQLADLQNDSSTAVKALLKQTADAEAKHAEWVDVVMQKRTQTKDPLAAAALNNTQAMPLRRQVQATLADLIATVRSDVEADRRHSSRQANLAIAVIVGLGALTTASAVMVAWRLSRDLRREVGAAVGHIQSSSAQLEAAAAQQVNGGRDQASAINEITTTINELLITSRQIADSAQRVSQIAEETEAAARTGDATIDQTRASITAIRTQVDQIVQHMLALGEKSQQIGGVVDLVSELAEQTNILAINATIEASGAGEWGRRFAVVAEEIRKLADRTAASAKEIRALIDDVRGAVNTTVMATEIGAKAVDAGARQFDEATNSFREIAQLVSTTNDATREIELSTKQQTTAVEQVNLAVSDTARVSRETESSAVQTKQTAAHLSTLSGDLLELVGTRSH